MKWKKGKIGEHCEVTSSKRIFYSEYVKEGIPFYRSKEIIELGQGQVISEPLFISQHRLNEIKKSFGIPMPGDMLLTSVGTIGVPYVVKSNDVFYFKDGNLTWFRKFDNILSSLFLYYWIGSKEGFQVLNNSTIGSSQKALTISALKNIECPLPPLPTQERIASILSAYDELIETNRRQIKLLAEAAQRLYKEWFVDLRFPGWEETKIVDGTPEGWRCGRADEFFEITIGKTPPRSEKKWFTSGNNGIPWVSISDMGVAGMYIFITDEGITKESVEQFNMKIVPPGTVLLSFKLTVGRVSITTIPMCTNEAIAHFIIHNPKLAEYTYLYLRNFEYDTLGNTSSISKAVNSTIIKSMKFIMPRSNILEGFSAKLSPIMKLIYNKKAMCIKLSESRDRLLPKLMTGEIEV